MDLLTALQQEKKNKVSGGIYHKIQIAFAYNSNHIEGSTLTEEQTRNIFETNTVDGRDGVKVDDIIESANHFRCVDFCIDNVLATLNEEMIKKLHQMLKSGTADGNQEWFRIGDYKSRPNEVGGKQTTPPSEVHTAISELLTWYNKTEKTFVDITEFHQRFESIHPFQDGNGRVGRLIMFKECLANNIMPFIITDDKKLFYYRGLREWNNDKEFLLETLHSCQDEMAEWLKYFGLD